MVALGTLGFLDVSLNDELRSAKEELLANQQPDGSWGAPIHLARTRRAHLSRGIESV